MYRREIILNWPVFRVAEIYQRVLRALTIMITFSRSHVDVMKYMPGKGSRSMEQNEAESRAHRAEKKFQPANHGGAIFLNS